MDRKPMMVAGVAVAVALVFALCAGVASADKQGPGGNSAAAKACQKTGYQDWVREDGSAFETSAACTAYAAEGGTLQPKLSFAGLCSASGDTFTPVGDGGQRCVWSDIGLVEFALIGGQLQLFCPVHLTDSSVSGGPSSWSCLPEGPAA
jgi:hypothetical protein